MKTMGAAQAVVAGRPLPLCLLLAAALSACGGGNSDGPASTASAESAATAAASPQPTAPAMSAGTGSTALSWTAPRFGADMRPVSDLTGYKLYRATSPDGPFVLVATITNPSTLSYVDSGLSPASYYYAISTTSIAGESDLGYVAAKVIP